MLPRIFKGVYHFTVYAIGILVLTAAVLVTLIRLLLPDIGIYRGEVEAWVSNYMGYPVVIRTLDATWEGWVPYLELSDIDLLNRAGTTPITRFDSATIRIAPLATLLKRHIVPKQLTVKGFELAIARLSSGALYVEGINFGEVQATSFQDNELAEWLFNQEKLKIEDAKIEWIDIYHQQDPILLTDVNLQLRSDGKRLQAEGAAQLPGHFGKTMDFSFDASGNLLSTDWSGELYLSGHDINPDNWYSAYRPEFINFKGGKADIKVWSTWQQTKLATLEGELKYNDFETVAGNKQLHIKELDYRFFGERTSDKGWQFHLKLNQLLTANGNWPQANLTISASRPDKDSKYSYSTSFDYLKLDDLSPFISNLSFIPDTVKKELASFSIEGQLREGKLIYDPAKPVSERFQFDTRFENINADLGKDMPALSNMSGHLYGYLDKGVLSLDTRSTELNLEMFNIKSLQLNSLKGEVSWIKNTDEWSLNARHLNLENEDISAELTGLIRKPLAEESSPFVDLIVNLGEADLEQLASYLPYTSRFKFRDWMQKRVVGGRLSSGTALIRGDLSDFPFDEHSGRFQLIANTANATLDYSEYWPPVDNIAAEIVIDGREMRANIGSGQIFDANISAAEAVIPDIFVKEKDLSIDGRIHGVTRDLTLFIEQSPLNKDKGLNEISRSLHGGQIAMSLALDIPIKQVGKTPVIDGTLQLSDSTLKSGINNLQLDSVGGEVSFTRDSVDSESMNATFAGNPVELSISGSKQDKENPPAIKVHGMGNNEFVADRLLEYFPALSSMENYLRGRMLGEAEWHMTLSSVPGQPGSKKLEISSDLNGLEIDFPAPVGKPEYRKKLFKVTSYLGAPKPSAIQLDYANVLHAELMMDENKKLQTINLQVGTKDKSTNQKPGLHIAGAVEELAATQWWEVIKERTQSKNSSNESILDKGISINLSVAALELMKHRFRNVELSIHRPEKIWNFNLLGENIEGDILIPSEGEQNKQITFQLEKLKMGREQQQYTEGDAEKLNPADIPAIAGTVKQLEFNNFQMGSMDLQTQAIEGGLSVEKITFTKPGLFISGLGTWSNNATEGQSRFEFDLQSDEMVTMLETFDYKQSPVKKGETTLSLKASWPGSPMDYSLEKLSGTLDMQISKGHLLDVNPSAGRLFGLFSLQTLSRRLTLDFSDIFGKGMAFDAIEGSFDIDNGNAYTNDLTMRGPSANVAISGRTGLSEQDYDQIVTVTPQFSDNLPVAGVFLGPVGIGLGAVFYLAGQMFDSVHDGIDKLLQFQYTITGSWNQPVIEKIKTQKNDQQLSEAAS
ncbi:MAG: TIGR02099 family protein [Gammaproteobacteria bacterium]|nr:TIGR02099 family protein [Gammaproteobacteria bacterium]